MVGAGTRPARDEAGWTGLYFGGVTFKYQRRVSDLATGISDSFEELNPDRAPALIRNIRNEG
ncbi:MAG: hypothetical protein DWQ04_07690 [Chloroflexi bacterium]|nr:MAG: hypothetical protein DWQ04_07690 [Chloroflexota bacterium]